MEREDARDALILGRSVDAPDPADIYAALPAAALIGTASVRRQAQLLHARPDLRMTIIRGNVQTRLRKLREGDCLATMLAFAGLKRLGMEHEASLVLDAETMVPAACQGIVGITVRADDVELRELLAAIEDPQARAVATAERAMLAVLDGSCRTPIGGHARLLPDGQLMLTGLVARADGSFLLKAHGAWPAGGCRAARRGTGGSAAGGQPGGTCSPDRLRPATPSHTGPLVLTMPHTLRC